MHYNKFAKTQNKISIWYKKQFVPWFLSIDVFNVKNTIVFKIQKAVYVAVHNVEKLIYLYIFHLVNLN